MVPNRTTSVCGSVGCWIKNKTHKPGTHGTHASNKGKITEQKKRERGKKKAHKKGGRTDRKADKDEKQERTNGAPSLQSTDDKQARHR